MKHTLITAAGHTAALDYAVSHLKRQDYLFAEKADKSVTHLLLPVPSFDTDGSIKGGGSLLPLLEKLPKSTVIIGGNLEHPDLTQYHTVDLLKNPTYVAQNANITAHCAIKLAMNKLPVTLHGCPALVIGWGRIGKCLSHLLRQLGADVTIATRNAESRAILEALGYKTICSTSIKTEQFRLIYNTAPAMVCSQCDGNAIKIDLASQRGLGGLDVIWARGLPGKDAPETSGILIANTIIQEVFREEREL